MKLLLDTQSFLWSISAPERLGARARRAIQSGRNELFVSAISAWEIAIKSGLGRLTLSEDPQSLIPHPLTENAFEPLPVQSRHALKVVDLPNVHRDPFDRLLVAQALIEELVLLSGDTQLEKYPVRVIW